MSGEDLFVDKKVERNNINLDVSNNTSSLQLVF